ncbi:MFS transporter [Acetobacter musti]|uniref:MFS transporter n=1 Tax=Acetobacter musti TaxID=864732 RepID=A0ABX0JJH5_9PROT|nr:MFS transporter [Acetobacter musti]NHN83761.1 MFS transporter [Acetobacter musti]
MMEDPHTLMARSSPGKWQIIAICVCVLLNGIDGFDVLSISFAAPGIAAQWGVDRSALGFILSMELLGMSAGSIVSGNLADRTGRRPVILGCLVIMSCGMWACTQAWDLTVLSLCRLFTGFGVGGMLACGTVMVSELSNAKFRNLSLSAIAAGYPLGAVAGGYFASRLLIHGDWRNVFMLGGCLTLFFIPVVMLLLPESVTWLAQRQPPRALERLNRTLRRYGHEETSQLPLRATTVSKTSLRELLSPPLVSTTLLLTLAYFSQMLTYYFILKWVPKLLADMGFSHSEAGTALVWVNIGGLISGFVVSALSLRVNMRKLVMTLLIMASGLVVLFGRCPADMTSIRAVLTLAGFCSQGAVNGLFAIIAQSFPERVRGSGTGFVFGFGRGGAAIGPVIAGWLLSHGLLLSGVTLVMATGAIVAACAVFALGGGTRSKPAEMTAPGA